MEGIPSVVVTTAIGFEHVTASICRRITSETAKETKGAWSPSSALISLEHRPWGRHAMVEPTADGKIGNSSCVVVVVFFLGGQGGARVGA